MCSTTPYNVFVCVHVRMRTFHPGVVATKVRYFGVKSTKVPLGADGTKPAKVAHRGPGTFVADQSG